MQSLIEAIQKLLNEWGNGIMGGLGLVVSSTTNHPKELLLWLSIIALFTQILHTMWRFCGWCKYFWKRIITGRRYPWANKNRKDK